MSEREKDIVRLEALVVYNFFELPMSAIYYETNDNHIWCITTPKISVYKAIDSALSKPNFEKFLYNFNISDYVHNKLNQNNI